MSKGDTVTKSTPIHVHNSNRWDLRYRTPSGEIQVPAASRGEGAMIGRPGIATLTREQYDAIRSRLDAHAERSNGAILVLGV